MRSPLWVGAEGAAPRLVGSSGLAVLGVHTAGPSSSVVRARTGTFAPVHTPGPLLLSRSKCFCPDSTPSPRRSLRPCPPVLLVRPSGHIPKHFCVSSGQRGACHRGQALTFQNLPSCLLQGGCRPTWVFHFVLFLFFKYLSVFEGVRAEGQRERERGKERVPSRPRTVSAKPDAALSPPNRETTT